MVDHEANVHAENENISMKNYIEGTKLFASYFYQLNEVGK